MQTNKITHTSAAQLLNAKITTKAQWEQVKSDYPLPLAPMAKRLVNRLK